jgi:hypothetical protein
MHKNWQCSSCTEFANNFCILYKCETKHWELCPDWTPLWEEI